jgi:hypothetical protein
MKHFLIKYFYLTFSLIDIGLLTFATTISGKGLNVDLNVAALTEEESSTAPATRLAFDLNVDLNVALAEEQLSTTPFHSATSQVAPTSIASREKPDLPRYQTKSFTPSSSGLRILSLGSTSANKRKGGEQLEQQVITKFFRGEEKDLDYSKQQAEGTEKDGKMISEIPKSNPLQPEDVENVPRNRMERTNGVIVTPPHTSDHTEPESTVTQLDNSPEVSNVIKDWNFVKVEGGAEILNWYIKPPGENHDEKDLFAFMEKLNHEKQDKSPGVFWIEREYADKFFKSYSRRDHGQFVYPNGMSTSQRASALQQLIVKIYDQKISPEMESFKFLQEIKKQFNIDTDARMERLTKIMKMLTVLSIMYLSLYREHQVSIKDHILELANCIDGLLQGLGETKPVGNKLTEKWYDILRSKRLDLNFEKELSLSWRTVEYWLTKNRQHLDLPPLPKNSSPRKKYCHLTLTEIVHKIIIFSNIKSV